MLYNGGLEKRLWRYELNYTGSQYGPVMGLCDQWWTCCKNIIQHRVIKHNAGSGSSQSAHTYLWFALDPSNPVRAADCSALSPCWCQRQLHCDTNRLPVLPNVCICKHEHNHKLTSQSHTDSCTSCSRQTTTFRHVNMLTYCTFLQFLSTLHHPDWNILTCSRTLWNSLKVDEEMWTMLGQSNCNTNWHAKT
jgi:hypothetical protein